MSELVENLGDPAPSELPYNSAEIVSLGDVAQPDVTVVVICYNDAEHLPNAVQSVLNQSLANVEVLICDDHSTDETEQVATELAQRDPRVRYFRLPENSGGCGAPRNMGIEHARGRYIMFLDSDDRIERHACKNMLVTAIADESEIVTALMLRLYLDGSGFREYWYRHLYADRLKLSSIEEFPELIHDTTATNKLYSREFFLRTGLRFPTDIHYEDIAFSAHALTRAQGISVMPEMVYVWNVYASDVRKSITNQRDDEKNLRDRMHAIELARTAYSEVSPELRFQMDLKILRHHLRLYLNDIGEYEDDRARKLIDLVIPYVERVDLETLAALPLTERALYASLYTRDIEAVRRQVAASRHGAISGRVFGSLGSSFWSPARPEHRPAETPHARAVSDFGDTYFTDQSHTQLPYSHELRSVTVQQDSITLAGTSTDSLGKLATPGATIRVHLRTPDGETDISAPAAFSFNDGETHWSVVLPRPTRTSLRERRERRFFAEVTLPGGAANTAPLRISKLSAQEIPAISDTTAFGRALGDHWAITSGHYDMAELNVQVSGWGGFVRSTAKGAAKLLPGKKTARRLLNEFRNPYSPLNEKYVYPWFRKRPLDENLCLFEANMGGSAFDSPRAVYEALRELRPDLRAVWVHNGNPQVEAELPAGARVRRGSRGYLRALARARYLVDNQSLPSYFVKRPGQRYLQTWHGIPYKKIGFDHSVAMSPAEAERMSAAVSQWDGLIAPSPYFERVFLPAFGYSGPLVAPGTPRNDRLRELGARRDELKRKLDIPLDRKVVLFAPTFRDGARGRQDDVLQFDLANWQAALGESATLLIRSHYLNRFQIDEKYRGLCINVSDYGDLAELYALSDVLVTDYSSVMFDFAELNRPIVVFAPDYEEFTTQSRGAYFDLQETPPGPFAETEDELFAAVHTALGIPESALPMDELARFKELYCGEEDGHAAERAARFLLAEERNG